MTSNMRLISLAFVLLSSTAFAAETKIPVADDHSLRTALSSAKPGHRILLAPGRYRPNISFRALHGTQTDPIIIEAADAKNKPIFDGGGAAIHLGGCSHLTLRNLIFKNQTGNGINIDDGGSESS